MKTRSIKRLLVMRKYSNDTLKYELDQNDLLDFLLNMWGQSAPSKALQFNDRVCLFGIIMTITKNCPYFELLAKGVANKYVLDDVDFNPKIYSKNYHGIFAMTILLFSYLSMLPM